MFVLIVKFFKFRLVGTNKVLQKLTNRIQAALCVLVSIQNTFDQLNWYDNLHIFIIISSRETNIVFMFSGLFAAMMQQKLKKI